MAEELTGYITAADHTFTLSQICAVEEMANGVNIYLAGGHVITFTGEQAKSFKQAWGDAHNAREKRGERHDALRKQRRERS